MWLYLERAAPLLWVTAQAMWVLTNHNSAPPTYFNVVSSFLSYFFLLAFRSSLETVVLHVVVVLVCLWEEASPRSSYSAIMSPLNQSFFFLLLLFLNYYYYFFLLYNIVLVLPYINMNPPRLYTCSPSWTPLPPPSPYHPSGSSQCTSPKLPVSCI